jgi:acyl dehydratase
MASAKSHMSRNDGPCFEDFEPGQVVRHAQGRTISSADNSWFTLLTCNPNPVHFDHHYAASTDFGQPLVNSCLTLSVVTGLSVADISRNGVNLGWERISLPHPLFEGQTLYAQSEVLEVRASRSRPEHGIVRVLTLGYTEDGTVVLELERAVLVQRRAYAQARQPPGPAPRS